MPVAVNAPVGTSPSTSDPAGRSIPLSAEPPLRELLRYSRAHRGRTRLAVGMSLLNKLCDVAPELLIGAAVDIVVNGDGGQSFVGRLLGIEDRFAQLSVLVAVTVVIWLAESATEYLAVITWRNLAQTIQHDLRMDAYAHTQGLEMAYFEDRSTGGLLAILNDDINQLERFLDGGINELHPGRHHGLGRRHHLLRPGRQASPASRSSPCPSSSGARFHFQPASRLATPSSASAWAC
jgi:ABC-type multidrug transport system fused ATPase/permease subunit